MSIPKSYNIVRDYDKAQGTTHPSDLSYQIVRDYGLRYITIENSSMQPIGIAIKTYASGPVPPILFTLVGGEIKHLGINEHGGPMQYIWILDIETKNPVGKPSPINSNSNQLVLRDGMNKWFIQYFYRPSYSAAK